MAYQAIYRKWRPMVFDDIVGQNHITKTLKNQLRTGKLAHAYLFCGTRGTGKTTAAKVFARAVNCPNANDGSPCNECEVCRGILDGSILDVSEIDAASNNGVDNIREILEDVKYVATHTKYSVYIIDEVHMLSQGAFNALLKTLEEPPEHVIFILATTEAHRVPETILSRCQRFDFKRIRPSDIIVRMKEIAVGDNLDITDEAYGLLAQFADGSMRDGLSILERCVSECGSSLSAEDVISVLGITPFKQISDTASAIISQDSEGALKIINTLSADGKDLNVYIDLLSKHFRDLMVVKVSENPTELLEHTDSEIVALKNQAEQISFEKISAVISALTAAKAEAKWVKNPRTIYELALIKLTQPELDLSQDALLSRIERLEEQIKNGEFIKGAVPEKAKAEEEKIEKKPQKEVSARIYVPIDKEKLTADTPIVKAARGWDKAAQSIAKKYPYIAGAVVNRRITIDGEGIILIYKKSEMMLKKIAATYIKSIQSEFLKSTGLDFVFKTVFDEDIEGRIIDYWKLPNGEGMSKSDKREISSERESDINEKDPLEELSENFPEIVEFTDDNDFSTDTKQGYEQTEIDDDVSEEFLDDSEKEQEI